MIGGGAVDMAAEAPALDRDRILTLLGIAALVALALMPGIDWDVGFVAVTIAVVLSLLMPHATKGAADKVAWPTVLLICGIVMYVALLEEMGTIDWLGEKVAERRHAAARRAADLLHRRRRVRVRLHHRHPRRADPARRAVPRRRARSAPSA